jgi:hypothetical protein
VSLDPNDIGWLENLVASDRHIKGRSGLIHRIFGKPFLEPARRLAQLAGGFVQCQCLAHLAIFAQLVSKVNE